MDFAVSLDAAGNVNVASSLHVPVFDAIWLI